MEDEEEVPEVSDAEELLVSYGRIKALLTGFENDSLDWQTSLFEELNNPIKSNLINRINVQDGDNEFFTMLKSINPSADRSTEFEPSQDLLDTFKLDNELVALLTSVELAKVKSGSRTEKLQASFRSVKSAQLKVVDIVVRRLKAEAGLTRIESVVSEHGELIEKLKKSLADKKHTIMTNNKEKELSGEELRHKYELETEEKIRMMVQSIDMKTKDLNTVTAAHTRLKAEYSHLQNNLGTLLHSLEAEEKAGTHDVQAPVNPVARFRASIYRNAAAKGTSTNLFGDVTSGTITEELVTDSQRALTEAFEKQQQLYASITGTEERTQALRKELTQLMQSEENKALDRLKKVCDNLQVKIHSDEQRVKVMAALVNQIHKGDQNAHRQAPVRVKSSDGTTMITQKKKKRAHASRSKDLKSEVETSNVKNASAALPPELMNLVPDYFGNHRESISMNLHRRVYAQYYEIPEDANKDTSSDSESEANATTPLANLKPSAAADLPRKRRITPSQSAKVQKIMDMINLQYTKLSTVKEQDIKHIFDYRAFPDDADRMSISPSSRSNGSAKSSGSGSTTTRNRQRQQQMQQQNDRDKMSELAMDHTKMFQSSGGGGGGGSRGGSTNGSRASSPKKESSPRTPINGSRQANQQRAQTPQLTSSLSDEHLRIPVTADLEDREGDAEFYAQNYGVKLALEHLTAIMEVLTSGKSTDTAFISNQQSGKSKVGFARNEGEEMQTVEELRAQITKLIALIRELHFLSQNNKQVRKDLQKEVDNKLKECDRLRNDLLQEVEGSHWPQATKAGQFEMGIEQSKDNLKELKTLAKQWDQRVSIKRAQNIRLSQAVATASTRRATVMHKLDPHSEAVLQPRKKPRNPNPPQKIVAKKPELAVEPKIEPLPSPEPRVSIDYNFSVANKRMSLFDDISHIYDTAMSTIRATDSSIPYDSQAVVDVQPGSLTPRAEFALTPIFAESAVQLPFSGDVAAPLPVAAEATQEESITAQSQSLGPTEQQGNLLDLELLPPKQPPLLLQEDQQDQREPVTIAQSSLAVTVEVVNSDFEVEVDEEATPAEESTAVNTGYGGYEEDQGSDGWEDILAGYEGDKSDLD